jgi:hypothetical protein
MCTATTNNTRTSLHLQPLVPAKVVPPIALAKSADVRHPTLSQIPRLRLLESRVHMSCCDGDDNNSFPSIPTPMFKKPKVGV